MSNRLPMGRWAKDLGIIFNPPMSPARVGRMMLHFEGSIDALQQGKVVR